MDRCQRSLWSLNPRFFSTLRCWLFAGPCSEDNLKVRSNPCFDKGRKPELSTFARISCGRWWTTQRFIASSLCARKSLYVASLAGVLIGKTAIRILRWLIQKPEPDGELSASKPVATGSIARAVPLGQQSQSQSIQFDEACCVLLVIRSGVVFERHMSFGIK